MFCPWCGDALVESGNTLECRRGGMQLSAALRQQLDEVFVQRSRRGKALRVKFQGAWHCPGCGAPTVVDDGHIRCVTCGELLDEFIYPLVELHPHR
jgi:uncharacterized Zn finger protein (UPF0148 family)